MKKLLLVLAIFVFASNAFADSTFVYGTIDGETWTTEGSPYIMIGDLFIANLTIMPGVTIVADGDYEIEVAGLIDAIGTEQDSIIFTKTDTISGWQGIFFNVTTFPSVLKYCRIEHATNAGIRIFNSTPTIQYCTLINNTRVDNSGGGINIYNDTAIGSEFDFKGCRFINNRSKNHGGALRVYAEDGNVLLDSTYFEGNVANGLGWINGNWVGGAIWIQNGSVSISRSVFIANRTNGQCSGGFGCDVTARGGSVYMGSTGNLSIENSTFLENQTHAQNNGDCFFGGSSRSFGAAVYVNAGTATIANSIFSDNTTTWTNCNPSDGGGGVYVNGGSVTVTNCVIANNSNATGAHIAGGTLDIINSILFFNNGSGDEIGGSPSVSYSCVQDGDTTNGNITDNPVFVDSLYHLGSLSPCIDAGNPAPIYNDPEDPNNPGFALWPARGTLRNDMGRYGGPGVIIVGIDDDTYDINNSPILNEFLLFQNYPNPFNPATTIRYQLSKSGKVTLTVYNLLGQQVRTLVNERQPAGAYRVEWDGRNEQGVPVASGVYLYRLKAGNNFVETRKMLLIR